MADWPPVLSIAALVGFLAVAYVIGRLLVGVAMESPGGIVRAAAPILGASAVAIQLWIYGGAHIPWNPLTILLPWLAAAVIRRRALRFAVQQDWRGVWAESRRLAASGPLELVLLAALVVIAAVYLLNLVTQPVLGWDAIAMWLFKANLFYSQQAVDLGPISTDIRRNLDYPPLYPLMVDSLYGMTGHADDIFGKSVTYLFFPTGIVGFFIGARDLVGRQLAITFTFVVAASPIFMGALFAFPYMGWADYPLAILMLVSLLLLVQGVRSNDSAATSLAVLFAALAALTKNEGLTFLGSVILVLGVRYLLAVRRGYPLALNRRRLVVVLVGVAPLMAWVLYVKLNGIQSARLVAQTGWRELLPALPGRFVATLTAIRRQWSFKLDYPWLAGSYLLSTALIACGRTPYALPILGVITLQAVTYLVVYLVAPFDAQYIVSVTFDRLMLQLTPSLLLLLAIAVEPYTAGGLARQSEGHVEASTDHDGALSGRPRIEPVEA